jgi:hypothetical protein
MMTGTLLELLELLELAGHDAVTKQLASSRPGGSWASYWSAPCSPPGSPSRRPSKSSGSWSPRRSCTARPGRTPPPTSPGRSGPGRRSPADTDSCTAHEQVLA